VAPSATLASADSPSAVTVPIAIHTRLDTVPVIGSSDSCLNLRSG
jgi:hypothetical protein